MNEAKQSSSPEQSLDPRSLKTKRHIKNYLLQPLIQVKLGIYCIFLSLVFAVALIMLLKLHFGKLFDAILVLTDAEHEVREIFQQYLTESYWQVALAFLTYVLITVLVSVLFMHKLVGPTVAFRRHIRALGEGQHTDRTYLRKGDAFTEVADELNNLSEVLERQSKNN